jgi:boron transporter
MQSSSDTYTIPTHHRHADSSTGNNKKKRPWQTRLPFLSSKQSPSPADSQAQLSREHAPASGSAAAARKWWHVEFFSGMINDLRRRAPFYWSDWRDAWDYRVVPATVYMYFAKYVFTNAILGVVVGPAIFAICD